MRSFDVFDSVSHSRKEADAANPIFCPFNALQIADGGPGFNRIGIYILERNFWPLVTPSVRDCDIAAGRRSES
jgi:hypothetical protein